MALEACCLAGESLKKRWYQGGDLNPYSLAGS
ncbi:MAG: hypothetical protein ACI9F9_003447, partial [Candidatus Paceibacteria bacterium]